jgi:hypothetical protein
MNPIHSEEYSIQYYVIKLVSDLQQVDCCPHVQNLFRIFRICSEFSAMFRIWSEFSVMFRICSEFSAIFRIFRICSEFSAMFRICSDFSVMFRICSEFSESVQNFQHYKVKRF